MGKTISNVLKGVAALSVSDEHSLAEWDKTIRMAGLYSAHLKKDGLSTNKSTHVQFNPTFAAVLFSRFQANFAGFKFWEKTDGGLHYWSQFELRFEQPSGKGWAEFTIAPHQAQIWAANWTEYPVSGDDIGGFGGQTPNGTSFFTWPFTNVTAGIGAIDAEGSMLKAIATAEPGVDASSWVLARVRIELWETSGARECWIGDVTIDDHVYAIEPGSVTPGLVLDSPNTEIGYTEDGVTIEYTADEEDTDVEEETFSIGRSLTKETAAVTCNMAESSLFNIDKAMAGAVLVGNVLELGGGVNKIANLKIAGLNPAGFIRTIYIPKATATGAVGMSYRKGPKTIVPVTFQALKPADRFPVTMVDNAA